MNIQAYVIPVLLSPNLVAYKGDQPVQLVFVRVLSFDLTVSIVIVCQSIIKKHRFDTPPGFEHNAAERGKIIVVIQDAFTQGRSKLKKLVCTLFYFSFDLA